MNNDQFLGTWTSVESEISAFVARSEAYHFYPPNIIVMEFLNESGDSDVSRYRFEVEDDEFRYGSPGDLRFVVKVIQSEDDMLWTPTSHGKTTRVRRIHEQDFPSWIRGHKIAQKLAEQVAS